MREFSDKYSLHLAIALQNFKLALLVNVVSLSRSICPTSVCNSTMSFASIYFNISSGNYLSFELPELSYVGNCSIKLKGEMNWSIIGATAGCTRKWARSALTYASPDNICTAVAELYTTWNNSEVLFHNFSDTLKKTH